ncbi:MAG: hypothetical protein ACYTEZ_16605 [Planctomycetota bacterium]|jgi:hypothetical protein
MRRQRLGTQRNQRWRYIIDWRQQLRVVAEIVGVLCGVCVVFAVVTFLLVLDRNDATARLRPDEIWSFLLQVTAVFTGVSAVVFVLLAIAISHRFVGPALVIRRAVQAMIDGWYDRRVTLRRRDYLRPLAAKVEELSDALRAQEVERKKIVADLHRCLEENDVAAAQELLTRLREQPPKRTPSQAVPEAV